MAEGNELLLISMWLLTMADVFCNLLIDSTKDSKLVFNFNSMNASKNIIFGLLLLLQVIFIVLIEIQLFSNMDFARPSSTSGIFSGLSSEQLRNMAVILVFTSIFSLAAIIIGILHLMQNKAIADDGRIVWILVLLLAGVIGQTIYFFKHMVKQQPAIRQKHPIQTTERPNKDFWNT